MQQMSNKTLNTYTASIVFQTIGTGMAMSYMNMYMTDYLFISAAVVSTALLIAKIADFVFSLVAGAIVEKADLKGGKYRGWYALLRWVMLFGFGVIFLDTYSMGLPEWFRATLPGLGYLIFGAGMSLVMITRGGLTQKMAGPNMEVRTKMTVRAAQGAALSTIVVSAIVIPLINFFTPIVEAKNAYFVVCVGLYMFTFLGFSMMYSLSKPYDEYVPKQLRSTVAPRVSAKDMVASVAGNSQLLILMIGNMLFYIGMNVFTGIQIYYFRNVINEFSFMATSMTIKTSFAFVASLFIPSLGRKLGKKNAMLVGFSLYAVGLLFISFFGAASKWMFTIGTCIFTAAMYIFTGFGVNYYLDCGEYGYYKTGKDNRAVALAMSNIPMKIGFAGGSAIGGYGLAIIGYKAGMEITAEFTKAYMWVIGGIPAALCVLAVLVILFGYKLTDAEAIHYAKENAAKDAAERAAEDAAAAGSEA